MPTDEERMTDLYAELKAHLGRKPTIDEVKILIFGSEETVLKLLGRT